MGNNPTVPFLRAFKESQTKKPLFNDKNRGTQPLTFEDSLSSVPDYPFCALGVLTASDKWGTQRGVAFVVEDNYLLTCASNCYSHAHGRQFQSLTFSIASNRKAGTQNHKIAKAFVPKEYTKLPKQTRNQFNYALLYIEGKPNLTDRYGSLGVNFNLQKEKHSALYLSCALEEEKRLKLIGMHKMAERMPVVMDGGPIVMEGDDRVFGLTFVDQERGEPTFLLFSHATYLQLAEWAKTYNGILNLYAQNFQQSDVKYVSAQSGPIKNVQMNRSVRGSKCIEIISHFPFYCLQVLNISSNKVGNNFIVSLKNEKFRNLKQLDLSNNEIGPLGCQELVKVSLVNLRVLSLRGNSIESEGCKTLLKGNWPFLTILILRKCNIGTGGLRSLGNKQWPNLTKLFLGEDRIDNEQLSPFGEGSFPRIDLLSIKQTNIGVCGLSFLMHPQWSFLRHINLKKSLLGNKGCKLIKQSKIIAVTLNLQCCNIDNSGIKWICKADLKRLEFLQVCDNYIGEQASFYLSKANTPSIQKVCLGCISLAKMSRKGVKRLLLANWSQQIIGQMLSYVQKIKKDFPIFSMRFTHRQHL